MLSRKQLVAKLDSVFSEYIRLRGSRAIDVHGEVFYINKCVTCNKVDNIKRLQAGHYISRAKYGTRWDEDNVHVQCKGCNLFKNGNYTEYAKFIVNKYGAEMLSTLDFRAGTYSKKTNQELSDMIDYYRKKSLDIKSSIEVEYEP